MAHHSQLASSPPAPTLIYSIHSPLPPQTFHTETSSYKPLSVAWEKVRGDDRTWLGAMDVISADTESVLVWIHGYNIRTGNLWKSKNGVRNKTGSICLLKRFERKSVWSTSANPLFTWSPPLSPALLPLSCLSFFLSVGAPHLFICALVSGNCTVATVAALHMYLLLLCVFLSMNAWLFSVAILFISVHFHGCIHLMLNFDTSPSFCSYLPWNTSLYVSICAPLFAFCWDKIQAFFFFFLNHF